MIPKKCLVGRQFMRIVGLLLTLSLVVGISVTLGLAQEKVKLTWSEWWDQEWVIDFHTGF